MKISAWPWTLKTAVQELTDKFDRGCCKNCCCIMKAATATETSDKHEFWTVYCDISDAIRTAALLGDKSILKMYYVGNPPHTNPLIVDILNTIKGQLEDLGYTVSLHGTAAQIDVTISWS